MSKIDKKGYIPLPDDDEMENFNKKGVRTRSVGGFTDDDYRYLEDVKNVKGLDKLLSQHFGMVKRWNKEYKKSLKQIEHYTKLRDKYFNRLVDVKNRYTNIMKYMNPHVVLLKPQPSLRSWRGKVWWGVEGKKTLSGKKGKMVVKRSFHKKGYVEFYIISEKKRKQMGYDEDDLRRLGREKFKQKIMKQDLLDIIEG